MRVHYIFHKGHSQDLPDSEVQKQVVTDQEPTITIKEGILSKPFFQLFIMAACGACKTIHLSLFFIFLAMGLLLANNYKVYGSTKIDDDHFLTLVGSFGSVANGCTRAVWALFFDKFGFRKVYFVLLAIQVSILKHSLFS